MLDLFEPILNLSRRESPQERYARECYEYEQKGKEWPFEWNIAYFLIIMTKEFWMRRLSNLFVVE